MRAEPALRIELRPSRRLTLLLAASHVGAAALLPAIALAPALKLALASALAVSFVCEVRRHALLSHPQAIVAVRIARDARCRVRVACGREIECTLLRTTYVASGLVILNLREPGRMRARHAILLGDTLDPDAMRRLRVWLRWGVAA